MPAKYLGHLFRYRTHKISLLPVNQIREEGGFYESTGTDPQFELVSNKKSLPCRWVFISYNTNDLDDILSPTLFYNKGKGYFENDLEHLSDKTTEKSCLVRLPYNLKSLRLDPAERPGRFNISDIKCIEVGFIPLLLTLSWREIEQDLKSPGVLLAKVLKGFGYIVTRGPIQARERLVTRYQGLARKRVIYDYKTEPLPVAPEESQWQNLIDNRKVNNPDSRIDVIIPVYRGYDETLNCIFQALSEKNDIPFDVIVINDASPEPRLTEKLRELSGKGLFTLLENRINLGFVKTVNIGMRLHPERDVVLLNSDTEVYNNWLDRLHYAAWASENTGTVTPFSNNAEICSYPFNIQDNNMQLELPCRELDQVAAGVNRQQQVQIPTGIGFCMYIRRSCLDEVGYFDEVAFGKGYGEENDFCLRAETKGWVSLLATDIFVRHVGGSSFGAEKQERVLNAIRTINTRYPGYDKAIQKFLYEDPVTQYRMNLDIGRIKLKSKEKAFLFVSHNWGGGTEKHTEDMVERLMDEGVQVYYLRPHAANNLVATLSCSDIDFLPNLPVIDLLTNTGTNAELLKSLGITHVHVHSLAGFNARFLSQLPEIIRHAGLQYDVTLHDYMTICPRIHLTDEAGRYCGEPSRKTCASCIRSHGTPFGKVDIVQWREQGHALLQGARKVFVPNNDVTERMRKYYPDVMYSLRPHFEADLEEVQPVRVFRKPGESVRVGIIGAIGPHKGSYILQRCARDALERQLPLEFVVLGYTNIESLSEQPNVTVTGKYEESEIHDLISEQHLHLAFFPATWPETYSYTLSLALSAGLKPVAFDIGAIADRMRRLGYEDLLIPFNMSNSPAAINDFLLDSIEKCKESGNADYGYKQYESLVREYYSL